MRDKSPKPGVAGGADWSLYKGSTVDNKTQDMFDTSKHMTEVSARIT